MPPMENSNDAVLLFVPEWSVGITAIQIATWGRKHGYGDLAYVPGCAVKGEKLHAAS